jgi:N-acetylmuramoyl-L-alanine amidase
VSGGHGPATPGKRTPDGFKEFQFNYPTAELVCKYLLEYQNVEVLRVYEATRDVPLAERTSKANSWGANLYVSVHYNAVGDGWNDAAGGIETLVYSTSTSSSNGYNIARTVQDHLIQATGLKNRGVKARPDLWEMRSTKMPAFLCECGFMSNHNEAALMKSAAYQQKVARAIVDGIAAHYSLKKKVITPPPVNKPVAAPPPAKGTLYRVQLGAFSVKANAERLEKQAEDKGFVDAYINQEGKLYKVQVGAFSNKANAERQLGLAKSRGFKDAWIDQ